MVVGDDEIVVVVVGDDVVVVGDDVVVVGDDVIVVVVVVVVVGAVVVGDGTGPKMVVDVVGVDSFSVVVVDGGLVLCFEGFFIVARARCVDTAPCRERCCAATTGPVEVTITPTQSAPAASTVATRTLLRG